MQSLSQLGICRPERRPAGFTLAEVAVCLFVMSFGVIGMGALLLTSTRMARDSSRYTHAVALAAELAESLRFQYLAADAGWRTANAPDMDFGPDGPPAVVSASAADCHQAACSGDQIARDELSNWHRRLAEQLPQARVKICRDVQPWDAKNLTYSWTCTPDAGGNRAAFVIKIGWREASTSRHPSADKSSSFAPSPLVVLTIGELN